MARQYAKATLPNSGADIYNAILADTPALQNAGMPFAATASYPTGETDSRKVGAFFYNNIDLSNQFISSLLNGIALRVVQSKYWEDPWVSLEKGKLDYGEVVQETFIKMAKPRRFNQARAEQEVFKRDIPDVMSAFHAVNYQYFYKQTISNEELRMAFNTWEGLTSFIADIIKNMFTSANYDVNQVKRYLIARGILTGFIHMETVPAITDKQTAEDAVAYARTASLNMLEMSPNYNYYGVPNYADLSEQVIILNNKAAGRIDVSVLAADFNMDKAEFLTMHRLAVSSFGNLDTARLAELFAEDPSYVEISQDDLNLLDTVPYVIFDRAWFQIYDYINIVTNIYNSDGLYWNYDLHLWKIFGTSPFSNAFGVTSETQGVTAVTVNPSAATVSPGQKVQLTANVETTGFAPQTITWSSDTEGVTVNSNGLVTVGSSVATGTSITITATSNFDSTKTATATITVG